MRFVKQDDCYKDTQTGLEWSLETSPKRLNWDDANAWCQSLGAGWRLPTRTELYTIEENDKVNPCSSLPGMMASDYWLSDLAILGGTAWLVNFSSGILRNSDKSYDHYVRAVRTQQGSDERLVEGDGLNEKIAEPPNKGSWMLQWCKKKGLAPANNDNWNLAEKAYDDKYRPEIAEADALLSAVDQSDDHPLPKTEGVADPLHHCLTCKYEPVWQITRYGTDRYAEKAGYCQKPMPFSDGRRAITFDAEWNDGLDEDCPAWEGK